MKQENRLYPFLCVYGDEDEQTLIDAVAHIYDSGARGLCVESKHSPHFCREHWWFTLDVLLRECKKRDMKMWTVDEPFVPSGYANGAVKRHPDLRKKHLVETHADMIGPLPNAKILSCPTTEQDVLLGAVAYKRKDEKTEDLAGEPIDLTQNLHNGIVYWDVPSGAYRVFFLYETQAYANDYVDFFNRESVQLIIDEVYEPHYKRYREEFGKTFAGFFSDEPGFWNPPFSGGGAPDDFCNAAGVKGYAMPWGENVRARMEKALERNSIGDLVALWYKAGDKYGQIRYAYMDAVTKLYYENFNKTLGDWCKTRGVTYNGHIVEDNGVHARLGMGVGHYFRAMQAYDVSGVDIVLHQVLPGFAHCRHASFADGGFANTGFYHYVLGQLAASDAHVNKKSGKALCEIFGAFGWGEDVSLMKWLVDFMLVRGVTNFIPHSFTTRTHDEVFPPTFSAKNNNPQFDGIKMLFDYVQKAGEFLEDGTHVASVALLYTAFAEWMHGDGCKALEQTARELYDNHICYDIFSDDTVLHGVTVQKGKLVCGKESYGALVIPPVQELPANLREKIREMQKAGAVVLFINELPRGCTEGMAVVLHELANELVRRGLHDITVEGNEYLRFYHLKNGKKHTYMLFNESVTECVKTEICVKQRGRYLRHNVLRDEVTRGETQDGAVSVQLSPYESMLYIFDDYCDREFFAYPQEFTGEKATFIDLSFDIYVAPYNDMENFAFYERTDTLFDIASFDRLPNFSGAIKYVTYLHTSDTFSRCVLDLGQVGGVVNVKINDVECGTTISAPYAFDISAATHKGINKAEITVFTPLAGAMIGKDNFGGLAKKLTSQIPLRFIGLAGPISVTFEENNHV